MNQKIVALVAAYFILEGKSVDVAVNLIKSKRPEIHIEPAQFEALKKFSRSS